MQQQQDDDAVQPQRSELSPLAVQLVLPWLCECDVVSCGQACRAWRVAASDWEVWRRRRLLCRSRSAPRPANHVCGWHGDRARYQRALRFAPALRELNVKGVAEHDLRVMVSVLRRKSFQVRELTGVGCQVQSVTRRLLRVLGRHLTVLELACIPDQETLDLVRRLPRLRELRVMLLRRPLDRVATAATPAAAPPAPQPPLGSSTVTSLTLGNICGPAQFRAALDLVRAYAPQLEKLELRWYWWGDFWTVLPAELEQCQLRSLRNLDLLQTVLQAKGPQAHDEGACPRRLDSLRTAVPGATIRCATCKTLRVAPNEL